MNKAQMLSFLFFLILGLVFFIPTVLWASQFFKLTDKSVSSYNELVKTITTLKEGEFNSVILHMKAESLIIGFSKEANKVEALAYTPAGLGLIFDYASQSYIERPSQCGNGKSCICLCQGLALEGNKLTCQKEPICSQFDKIYFFDKSLVGEVPFSHTKNSFKTEWVGGFFIVNSKDSRLLKKIYSNVDTVQPGKTIKSPMPVYVQRYKDYINVCTNRNCITNEMIDKLNKEEAIKEFSRFKEHYYGCAIAEGQVCNTFTMNLPERYYIYYGKLSSRILGINIPFTEKSSFILVNTEDSSLSNINKNMQNIIVKNNEGNGIYFESILWKSQDKEYEESILQENTELKMINDNNKIILR